MAREIFLDRHWKRLQTQPWPWRLSEKGNLYTLARGYLLIVRANTQGRWRCAYRPESADAANWETSGWVFQDQEEAKQWGLRQVGLTKLVTPAPAPAPGVPRRRIHLPDD